MWIVGDWGQASPWTRNTGVKMVEGDNGVWTGELSLPKYTKFDIKILKSTVSTTSGGDNDWFRYASTLNMPASYDFGEFNTNLFPTATSTHCHLSVCNVTAGYSPHVKTYHCVMPLAWGILI